MVILPLVQNELPVEVQQANIAWADTIVQRWQEAGANPIPQSKPLGYTGEQAEYFRRTWREFMPTIPHVTLEVQNNNTRTSPAEQAHLEEMGIRVSVEQLLE